MKISPPAATPVDKDKEIIISHKTSPIKKSGNTIIINSGANSNLKLGTEMEVYKIGAPIEYRGEILGYEEERVGNAVVTNYIGEEAASLRYDGKNFTVPGIVKIKNK